MWDKVRVAFGEHSEHASEHSGTYREYTVDIGEHSVNIEEHRGTSRNSTTKYNGDGKKSAKSTYRVPKSLTHGYM